MQQLSMEDTFSEIYRNRKWYKGSGSGSLVENTTDYRRLLQSIINRHDITTVIDVGCGDWQFSRLINWSSVEYTGIDVVSFVIESNKQRYKKPTVHFECKDILQYTPHADLVIIKDVLQHWPNADIQQLFAKLTRCTYILVTNSVQTIDISRPGNEARFNNAHNQDIARGGLRSLDLTQSPFNLPVVELLRYESVKRHAPFKDIKTVSLLQSKDLIKHFL